MKNHNMKRLLFKCLLFGVLMIGAGSLQAKEKDGDTKLTKHITRGFVSRAGASLQLINKYGQVVINTWEKDSIRLEVEVSAYAKGEANVKKIMDRVDFDFISNGDHLKVETILDREQDYFTELWNKFTDYSKVVLSKNNLSVNYKVYMPARTRLNLENKFGDVFIDELTEKSRVFISYGNLKAGDLNTTCSVEVQFGRADIKSIRDGQIKSRISEWDIQQSESLEVESASSTLSFNKINKMSVDSRNDKIRIESIRQFSGTGSFSKFTIESADHSVDVDMNFGSILISSVVRGFVLVDISGRSTDINLKFDRPVNCPIDIRGKEEKIYLPKECDDLNKKYDEKEKGYVTLSGRFADRDAAPAAAQGNSARVQITTKGGDIKIGFRQPDPEARKQ